MKSLRPAGRLGGLGETVAALLGVVVLATAVPSRPAGADTSRIAASLAGMGFENVAVTGRADSVTVVYENRIFRDPLEALGTVVRNVAPGLDPAAALEFVLLNRGIPFLSVRARAGEWVDFVDGRLSVSDFRSRIRITDASEFPSRPPGDGTRLAPPWRKIDAAFRPLADVQFGIPDDPFKYGLWLAPEVTTIPFRGALLTVQGVVQLHDEFDSFIRPWRPGRTTLSCAGRLPASCLGTASVGYFPGNRYGVAWEAGRYFLDGRIEVRLSGDYSGVLKFSRNNVVLYSDLKAWSGVLSVSHRLRGLDVTTTASGGRYLYGDLGGELEVARRFHELEFSFFGVKTEDGSVAGLRFTVPLPAPRWSHPRRVRLVTVPDFPFDYRENSRPVGVQVRLYDDLNRLRERVSPVYVWNNIGRLRPAAGREE